MRSPTPNESIVTSYAIAPTRVITTNGVTFAYREMGPHGGVPVIFFVHLAGTLDNWDPRIIDPIARDHHVIAFDNQGVGASTGQVPDSSKQWPPMRTRSSPHSDSTRSTSSRSPSAAWSPKLSSSSTLTSFASWF
jgi:pimeloyl-ACP methyl ester carboxylesterase